MIVSCMYSCRDFLVGFFAYVVVWSMVRPIVCRLPQSSSGGDGCKLCNGHMCAFPGGRVCVRGGGETRLATSIMRPEARTCVCVFQCDWPLCNGPNRPYCFRLVLKPPWQQMWDYAETTKAH